MLLVDDDPMMGSAVRRTLATEHEVVSSTNPLEALALIADGDRFDVIFCDLMMPMLTGMEFHRRLSGVSPEQAERIVFLTGGAFTTSARAFLDEIPNTRIEKPFQIRTLRTLINDRVR